MRFKRSIRILLFFSFAILLIGLTVSWFVAGALVAPRPQIVGDPPPDLPARVIELASQSGSTIRGWHVRAEPSNGVVVLLHGIGSSRLAMLDRAKFLSQTGYSSVLIDMQAHGESPGKQITVGYLERHDVRAAVEFARANHPDERVGVLGVSLGGAAALLGAPLGVDAMVLESVYPNIDDAVHNRVSHLVGPLASIPTALLLVQLEPRLGFARTQLRPIENLPQVESPVFLISGMADHHTTADETRAMFAAAQEPKELWLVEGAEHVDLYAASPEVYHERVLRFFDRYLRR